MDNILALFPCSPPCATPPCSSDGIPNALPMVMLVIGATMGFGKFRRGARCKVNR